MYIYSNISSILYIKIGLPADTLILTRMTTDNSPELGLWRPGTSSPPAQVWCSHSASSQTCQETQLVEDPYVASPGHHQGPFEVELLALLAPLALYLELLLLVLELPSVPAAAAGTSGQIQYSSQGPIIRTPGNASGNITGLVNMKITEASPQAPHCLFSGYLGDNLCPISDDNQIQKICKTAMLSVSE